MRLYRRKKTIGDFSFKKKTAGHVFPSTECEIILDGKTSDLFVTCIYFNVFYRILTSIVRPLIFQIFLLR